MNNKIFISGKITDYPHYASKFDGAVRKVHSEHFFDRHGKAELAEKYGYFGFRAVNPCDLTFFRKPLDGRPWWVCMVVCLWHLAGCSYVYMLNNWQASRGASKEHALAKFLRKKIIYQP